MTSNVATAVPSASGRTKGVRPLSAIAREIARCWPNMSVHAKPYVNAMGALDSIKDNFYADTAQDVVLRFLVNSGHWRGADARRIKAELRTMLRKNGYSV